MKYDGESMQLNLAVFNGNSSCAGTERNKVGKGSETNLPHPETKVKAWNAK